MKLSDYLRQRPKKRTASAIALQCGVAPSTISRIASGKIEPSLRRIRQIIVATDGEVRAEDWINDNQPGGGDHDGGGSAPTRRSRVRQAA